MRLYNTLTKCIEEFTPQTDEVSLYTCGPTVYNYAHIGNLRTYIFGDMLKRVLFESGYKVKHVMNITDIDDKTIAKGEGNKKKHIEVIKKYEKLFWEDLRKLNIIFPNEDCITRATQYIPEMVMLVKNLLDKGFAYKADDGSIYFSINKCKNYGKLSNLDMSGLMSGARVAQDEYSKENPADFVLWKAWDENDGEIFWEPSSWLGPDSELTKGRPGWHIECSAMSQKKLGETIDIHVGAVDLIFPHHDNEIAQSEASTGKQFARYWAHGEHLLVDNQKMSKSLNNFYILNDIIEKGFNPLDFRYLCLQAHYRSKLNFTWAGLEAAKNARNRLKRIAEEMQNSKSEDRKDTKRSSLKYLEDFRTKLFDDLNTPEALAVVWEMMRDDNINSSEKLSILKNLDDRVLALGLFDSESSEIPEDIIELSKKRDSAKAEKEYGLADKLRDQIEKKGYVIEDTTNGAKVKKA